MEQFFHCCFYCFSIIDFSVDIYHHIFLSLFFINFCWSALNVYSMCVVFIDCSFVFIYHPHLAYLSTIWHILPSMTFGIQSACSPHCSNNYNKACFEANQVSFSPSQEGRAGRSPQSVINHLFPGLILGFLAPV